MRRRPNHHHQLTPRPDDGSALIMVLVFLLLFGLISLALAQFVTITLKAGGIVEDEEDTLYSADDATEAALARLQNDLGDPSFNFAADENCLNPNVDGYWNDFVQPVDDTTFYVECRPPDEGDLGVSDNDLPRSTFALVLYSDGPSALEKRGETHTLELEGDVFLAGGSGADANGHTTGGLCFSISGLAACDPSPLATPVGPELQVAPLDVVEGGRMFTTGTCPDQGQYQGKLHFNGTPSTNTSVGDHWRCGEAPESIPAYPLPDTAKLRSPDGSGSWDANPNGAAVFCHPDTATLPVSAYQGAPLEWRTYAWSCVRQFRPGYYATNPNLSLIDYIDPDGSGPSPTQGVWIRSNWFSPGDYYNAPYPCDPVAGTCGPESGPEAAHRHGVYEFGDFDLALKGHQRAAPIVAGGFYEGDGIAADGTEAPTNSLHPTIVSGNIAQITRSDGIALLPPEDRIQDCDNTPGVQLIFQPNRGIITSPDPGRANSISGCYVKSRQLASLGGGRPGVLVYQKVATDGRPAPGSHALNALMDVNRVGGLHLDGIFYAPTGWVKAAVGPGQQGTLVGRGIVAWGFVADMAVSARLSTAPDPAFDAYAYVRIWECNTPDPADAITAWRAGTTADRRSVGEAECGAGTRDPDVTAKVKVVWALRNERAPQVSIEEWIPT